MINDGIGNRGGVPFAVATLTNSGSASTSASYTLPQNCFRFVGNKGLMVAYFNAATASTVTGINMVSNNVTLPLLDPEGSAITTAGIGYHILCFDKLSNTINMLS